jgi:hypothetical protein
MTSRPSELFAISAAVLLVFSFLSRLLPTQSQVSIRLQSVVYGFPPSTVCLAMASLLLFFAAIYATWPLPMDYRIGLWHYWITALAIAAFWGSFYLCAFHAPTRSSLTSFQTVALFGQFVSIMVIALAQGIFVANLTLAIIRLRHPA